MSDARERATIWSSGGGTQSTAIAVLILQGRLPMPDFAVIADTGREKSSTWAYLEKFTNPALESKFGRGIFRLPCPEIPPLFNDAGTLLIPAFLSADANLKTGRVANKGPPIKTILLVDVVNATAELITDHLWFTCGKQFARLDLQPGDRVSFYARSAPYVKGYRGYRDDEDLPEVSTDYRLSNPTMVMKLRSGETAVVSGRYCDDKGKPVGPTGQASLF